MQYLKWKKFHTQTGKENLWILLLILFRGKKKWKKKTQPNIDMLKQLLWSSCPLELLFRLNPSYYPVFTYVCDCNFLFQLGRFFIVTSLSLNRCFDYICKLFFPLCSRTFLSRCSQIHGFFKANCIHSRDLWFICSLNHSSLSTFLADTSIIFLKEHGCSELDWDYVRKYHMSEFI